MRIGAAFFSGDFLRIDAIKLYLVVLVRLTAVIGRLRVYFVPALEAVALFTAEVLTGERAI